MWAGKYGLPRSGNLCAVIEARTGPPGSFLCEAGTDRRTKRRRKARWEAEYLEQGVIGGGRLGWV